MLVVTSARLESSSWTFLEKLPNMLHSWLDLQTGIGNCLEFDKRMAHWMIALGFARRAQFIPGANQAEVSSS